MKSPNRFLRGDFLCLRRSVLAVGAAAAGFCALAAPTCVRSERSPDEGVTPRCAANAIVAMPASFRVMSYNIRHGAGAQNDLHIEQVGEVVRRESPRFVGLQEVDMKTGRVGGADTCAILERATGLRATFARAIDFDGGEYGNVVLSRETPRQVKRIPLPGGEPRVLLLCEFDDCWFGTTHLAVDSVAAREASVDIIRKAVGDCGGKPVYLSGDWNARPASSVLRGLGGFLSVLSPTNGPTFHGFARTEERRRKLESCIDYIAVDTAHVGTVACCGGRVVQDRETSDHFPLVVELRPTRCVRRKPCDIISGK